MRLLLKTCGVALMLAGHAAGQTGGSATTDRTAPTEHAAPVSRAPVSRAAVQAAVDVLRRDSNLGHDKTIKSLRWVADKTQAPAPAEAPNWIVGLFQFASQAGSLLLWVAGGIALAFAAVWIFRIIKARRPADPPPASIAASHIQDLDIRPASLPADVGAAALALLTAGLTRESLSLLYRGALSRAVHSFSVVIGESYTEGEALRAVTRRLDPARVHYFSVLVGLWQRAVYAADVPPMESVATLCREFSPVLGGTPI